MDDILPKYSSVENYFIDLVSRSRGGYA